jgi:FkbM family methyltransferase
MDNIEVLYYGLDVLFRARQGLAQGSLRVAVHHAAVVGKAGVDSVAFSVCGRGEELCGVEASGKSTSGSGGTVVQVPATTVDEAAARFGVPPVDILIIDAEGMDPEVLDGAAGMLAAGRVRVLQFEYHSLRAWASRSLREVVAQLGGWGYVCYLQQRELLLELGGGCWAEEYEFKSWANVLCVARHEAALLAAAHMFTPRALRLAPAGSARG